MPNNKLQSGVGNIRQMGVLSTIEKKISPATAICVSRHNKPLCAFIPSREHWSIARLSSSLKSVFKLKGLTFQSISVVALPMVFAVWQFQTCQQFPTKGRIKRMSFEPEDSASTCLPWRLPSSGRLEGGDVTPCPVYELTAAAPQPGPWGNSAACFTVFISLSSTGSWVLGSKVKVLVAQSRPTLCNPMYHTTRFHCPWNSPGKNTGVGSHPFFQGIFLTQGSNQGLPHCR